MPVPDLVTHAPWRDIDWLRHGTTTRRTWPDATEKHDVAVRLAAAFVGDAARRAAGKQVHGTALRWIDDATELPALRDATDALATARPGVLLACFTADCVPLVLVDVAQRAVGVAHAGWRGTYDNIARVLIDALVARGSRPADLRFWSGPAISGRVYEVSPELAAQFAARYAAWDEEVVRGRLLDLPRLNALQAIDAGLAPAHVATSAECTYSDAARYFSYRRDATCGCHLVTGVAIVAP